MAYEQAKKITKIVHVAARNLTPVGGVTFVLRKGNNCFDAEENAIQPLWKRRRVLHKIR